MGARGGGSRLAIRAMLTPRRGKETDHEQQRIQAPFVLFDAGAVILFLAGTTAAQISATTISATTWAALSRKTGSSSSGPRWRTSKRGNTAVRAVFGLA